ncbi:acyltransferase family protein [Pseudomonas aeruginosa]|uniref:acyltransferase family protein n=1 Tax=Pseudomonas aeruginosa TaxID=287 RepID=UPI00346312AB
MPGVDGLRAVAVMSVLLFHAGFSSLAGGYVGVDVFFVISGFLITRLIYSEVSSSGCFDYHRFYSRRVRRLFPALFVVVFYSFFVSLFLFSSEHLKRFGGGRLFTRYFPFQTSIFGVKAVTSIHPQALSRFYIRGLLV